MLMTTNQSSCAIPVKQLCQRSDTTVPTRWHNCAKPLAQPFPIEETEESKEEQEAEGSGEQENTEQAKDAQEQSQEQPEVQEEQQTK